MKRCKSVTQMILHTTSLKFKIRWLLHKLKQNICRHRYIQVDKEYYLVEEDGMMAKKLIDVCQKCGKRRER